MLWIARNSPNSLNLGVKSRRGAKPTLTPPVTEKHVAVTILEPPQQSQPSPTIHYTYNETLEGSRCCEILESIQTYSILVWWNVVASYQNRHHPWLKSQGVALIVDDEFKSQTCKTINHIHSQWIEALRCCELPKSVQTHSILVWKVGKGQPNFDPTCAWKTHCGDHFRADIPISTFSNHSLY